MTEVEYSQVMDICKAIDILKSSPGLTKQEKDLLSAGYSGVAATGWVQRKDKETVVGDLISIGTLLLSNRERL